MIIIVKLGYIHQMARIFIYVSSPYKFTANFEKVVLLQVFLGCAHKKSRIAHGCDLSLQFFFCNTNLNDCSPMILITFESLYEIVFH